jgi:hypothetical protein
MMSDKFFNFKQLLLERLRYTDVIGSFPRQSSRRRPQGFNPMQGGGKMKNIEMLNDSMKIEALDDMRKMWMWLYKHPAHDKQYYVSYVANLDRPWGNAST